MVAKDSSCQQAALLLLVLTALPLVKSLQCRTYTPQRCLFETNGSAPIVYPQPLHPSSFRLEAETSCPFYGSGIFQQSECGEDFMAEARRQLPLTDDAAFCASGSLPGEFKRQGEQYIFTPHPESRCNYYDYRRSEVRGCVPEPLLPRHAQTIRPCRRQLRL